MEPPRSRCSPLRVSSPGCRAYGQSVRERMGAEVEDEAGGPLSVAPFRYLWLNNITYALVMNALRFVFGWVVLDGLNRSESVQGLVVFLLGIPTLVIVLPAGVWADRMDRRQLLLGTQLGAAALLLGTALLINQGQLTLWVMIVSALLLGAVMAVGSPVRSSLILSLIHI